MQRDPADPHVLPRATQQTVVIATEGMRSSDCAQKVVSALSGMDGVFRAQADLESSRITVRFDPARTDVPALHEKIASAGYTPSPVADPDLRGEPEM